LELEHGSVYAAMSECQSYDEINQHDIDEMMICKLDAMVVVE